MVDFSVLEPDWKFATVQAGVEENFLDCSFDFDDPPPIVSLVS